MFAASLLVVAVMATYASLAVISLTAGGSLPIPTSLPGSVFSGIVKSIPWHQPSAKDVLGVKAPSSTGSQTVAFLDSPFVNFGQLPTAGAAPTQISVTNTSSAALPLALSVSAPGISASFAQTNRTTMVVHPHQAAKISLTSDPLHAGPILGSLVVSIQNSGSHPLIIPLSGAQAPLPSGSLTATPAKGGAVNLAWTASPSTGVSAYVVQRAAGSSGAWQTVATTSGSATSAVDQTGTDGAFTYRVIAEAQGISSGDVVQSPAGPDAGATAVKTPPTSPSDVGAPQYINADMVANDGNVVIPVDLAPGSTSSDTITVTLANPATGATAVGQAQGGGNSVNVKVAGAGALPDGKITVSATATDSVGNVSQPTAGPTIIKDTVPPDAPTITVPPIIGANVANVPVTVTTDSPGNLINVKMTDLAGHTAVGSDTQNAGDTTIVINVNALGLDDTPTRTEGITVTATATDEAGNASNPGTAVTGKDTLGPPEPTSIGVAAGPDNPAGVVTAQSANAVMVQVSFAQPPTADDQMVVWIAGQSQQVTADGQTSNFMVGPFDLTGLADGQYNVGIKQTDGDGNITKTWSHFTVDTGGAESPTNVGVPAGPNNPAGYVNAATQTAATIVATFAGPTDPADQISISVGGLDLPAQSGGSDQLSWTADLSSLPDGTIPITGTIVDGNGVSSTFSGSLIKDTEAPPAPAVAYVVGPPPNTIKQNDASCVKVFVAFNQAPDPSDLVTVSLSDGTTSATGSASAGDGHVVVGCIDAGSLSAGSISVNVTVTDVAGNSTDMTGTPATLVPCQNGQGQGQGGDEGE
jgi:hypothetical protein